MDSSSGRLWKERLEARTSSSWWRVFPVSRGVILFLCSLRRCLPLATWEVVPVKEVHESGRRLLVSSILAQGSLATYLSAPTDPHIRYGYDYFVQVKPAGGLGDVPNDRATNICGAWIWWRSPWDLAPILPPPSRISSKTVSSPPSTLLQQVRDASCSGGLLKTPEHRCKVGK